MHVWMRPMGFSWKLRLQSREYATEIRTAVVAAGAECSRPVSHSDAYHWLIFASFIHRKSHRELRAIIASVPGARLMHDPA